ncbi:MAG: hypothetical protein RLZZ511_2782 [Cyanobacteriota bacterium]
MSAASAQNKGARRNHLSSLGQVERQIAKLVGMAEGNRSRNHLSSLGQVESLRTHG